MVDRAVLAAKIAAIRDATERTRAILPPDAAAFAASRDAREIVALNLLVAIQETVDLAAHASADAGRTVPGTYREMFLDLASHGLIEAALAHRLASACGLRNLIAHQYGSLDWERLRAAASTGTADLDQFCAALARAALGG